MKLLTKIFGTRNDRIIKELQPTLQKINELEHKIAKMEDSDFPKITADFRKRFDSGETLDDMLPEAFAVCREAAKRQIGQRHYDVQVIGGIVLHQGKISEMKTGEGKTLTATLPCYLHGISGKGAHVVTVNDYLAKRDSEWMGKVYKFLGLTVGCIIHGIADSQRKEAYACDITYGTNNEFGFDYLRDNMVQAPEGRVQRGYSFAIVDEVDSILIDEARTPLIISGSTETNIDPYKIVNAEIPSLKKDSDYILDEKDRTVSLTEDGNSKIERRLKIKNLYEPSNMHWLQYIEQSLKAHFLFKKDADYVVKEGKVVIVDEHTGRQMPGRRYSDGLHGALEAKEHVQIENESQTLATITFQNYFRLYKTLSGMTGTADTEAEEFNKIYGLDVVVIPTNKTLIRNDEHDAIYRTTKEKFTAVLKEIKKAHKNGQPVLVGTSSVENSELVSLLLSKNNIAHEVLNAKNHGREAAIIAKAGQPGNITIATNMAGRGTDIVLGEGVREKGGLFVVGTERHESRRIDNQLRGRSGRQGDAGRTKFFISLEDDLMRIFASDKISSIMKRLGMEEGESIESPIVSRAIEKAQTRVEQQNFSSRKRLIEYDDVMNQHRKTIYTKRSSALLGKSSTDFIEHIIHDTLHDDIIERNSPSEQNTGSWDIKKISKAVKQEFNIDVYETLSKIDLSSEIMEDQIGKSIFKETYKLIYKNLDQKKDMVGNENFEKIKNYIYLKRIDQLWKEHLHTLDELKESVSLRGYGQRDPLVEYKNGAFTAFKGLHNLIEKETTRDLLLLQLTNDDNGSYFENPPELSGNAELTMQHPAPSSDEALIYHGSDSQRESGQAEAGRPPLQPSVREHPKVGRNDPCPCGSNKKYKKCHGKV